MKKFITFLVVLIHSVCSYSQSDTVSILSEARELQKHANLYFWYATESHHQLKHYYKAKEFCVNSNNLINDLNSPEAQRLFNVNNIMLDNLEEIELINIDNINGRYPLFNEIMNISQHKVRIDNPLELSIEASIELLGAQLKGSKSIFDLTYFTVIESNYTNPGLIEVMRQVISESSSHYVISSHELVEIIGENKTNFKPDDLLFISNYFNTAKLGVININLVDSINNIYYNQCSFSEYSVSSNKKTQIAYAEAFKEDVVANTKSKKLFLLIVFICLLILFIIMKGWRKITWTHYFLTSISISYFITFFLVLGLQTYDLNGTEFYLEINAITWRVLSAVLFSIIPLILTYIGIMKLKFMVEDVNKPSSIISIIYGVCISSLIFFVSLEVFENGFTNYLFNYLLVAVILFIPSQTSGRIASRLLINNQNINLIPLGINLAAITFIFYSSLLKHSIYEILALILPVTGFSIIPFYFNQIFDLLRKPFIIIDGKTAVNSLDHPIYIKPELFDEKVKGIYSSKVLKVNMISGVIGTGKTRLVKEIEKVYSHSGFYYGDCDKETSVIDYEPFVEAFKDNLGAGIFADQSAKAKILEKGAQAVIEKTGVGGQVISAIVSGNGTEEVRDQKFILKEITAHLKKKEDPVIITIEDINNIDENSLELLQNLIYEIGINYNEYNDISFLLTSTGINFSNENDAFYFLRELNANEIIESEILFENIDQHYANFKIDFLKNLDLEYESEMKILEFIDDVNDNPLHIVELIKLIDTYKMFNHEGKLSLIKKANLMTLPKNKAVSGIYQQEIEALDTELFNILECAAYIGKSFEADVIVHIIGKDRLGILNRLREAEDLELIIDKGDEDDIYEFTSRALMKEIRTFGMHKKGVDSEVSVSQIVKEYNDRVINYYYELDEDFDIEDFNINLLISLANRSFENNYHRKSYNQRCLELNKVSGERTFSLGKYQNALKMYMNLYKLANKFNDNELKVSSLLFIVKCYLKLDKINNALEMQEELRNCSCSKNDAIERDLLIAKLFMVSYSTEPAFELLYKLQENKELSNPQKITLKMLLAEGYDYQEKDDISLELYMEILKDINLGTIEKTTILYRMCNIYIQHNMIEDANKYAEDGYESACKQDSLDNQANFLLELFIISLKRSNTNDFEKHKKNILILSKQSSVNITNQYAVLLIKFIEYIKNSIKYSEISNDIDRMLKIVKYNNSNKEVQVFILKIIVDILEGNYQDSTSIIEENYLSNQKLDTDLRMRLILTLLYTDLSILNGKGNFNYFNKIDYSIVKEIPTLLPKFNYLLSLKDGSQIIDASKSYLDDIKNLNTNLMTEELPFSIKLSNDKKIINDILCKCFITEKLNNFLND